MNNELLDNIKYGGDKALITTRASYEDIVKAYEQLNRPLPILIIENTWNSREWQDFGWGNGYVRVDEHFDFTRMDRFNVHGGITFDGRLKDRGGIWLGFDTCHAGDTKKVWCKETVLIETLNLLAQVREWDDVDLLKWWGDRLRYIKAYDTYQSMR